jgi:hypothetical protein
MSERKLSKLPISSCTLQQCTLLTHHLRTKCFQSYDLRVDLKARREIKNMSWWFDYDDSAAFFITSLITLLLHLLGHKTSSLVWHHVYSPLVYQQPTRSSRNCFGSSDHCWRQCTAYAGEPIESFQLFFVARWSIRSSTVSVVFNTGIALRS